MFIYVDNTYKTSLLQIQETDDQIEEKIWVFRPEIKFFLIYLLKLKYLYFKIFLE